MQPVQDLTVEDRVSRTQFQYTLEDPDAKELAVWVPRLMEKLQLLPQLRDVASDQQNGGLETAVLIDRSTASRFGITPQVIDDTLYDAFGQRQIATMFTQLNQYRVVLEVKPDLQKSPASLGDLYIRSTGGGEVPLSAITHIQSGNTQLAINRQGQFPVVTASFNLAPGVSLGAAVDAVNQAKEELNMPASVQGKFQGTAAAFQASLTNTPILILAALVTVYIVLGVLYESYIHPITILSTLPSAGVGALLALIITRTDFSIIALIGIILLIGIVEKNAIMMIDFALEAQRQGRQARARKRFIQACLLRFRPIIMTTLAALLGGVPLALGTGTGAELRRPLGIAIVGGLIFSQLLTLYTTPVIYLWFDRLAKRTRRRRSGPGRTGNAGGSMTRLDKYFRAVHSETGGYGPSDCGPWSFLQVSWPTDSSPPAPLPQSGLSDQPSGRATARRQSGDDGLVGGDAPRAPVRPHRGDHGNELYQRSRLHGAHAAVRSEP